MADKNFRSLPAPLPRAAAAVLVLVRAARSAAATIAVATATAPQGENYMRTRTPAQTPDGSTSSTRLSIESGDSPETTTVETGPFRAGSPWGAVRPSSPLGGPGPPGARQQKEQRRHQEGTRGRLVRKASLGVELLDTSTGSGVEVPPKRQIEKLPLGDDGPPGKPGPPGEPGPPGPVMVVKPEGAAPRIWVASTIGLQVLLTLGIFMGITRKVSHLPEVAALEAAAPATAEGAASAEAAEGTGAAGSGGPGADGGAEAAKKEGAPGDGGAAAAAGDEKEGGEKVAAAPVAQEAS